MVTAVINTILLFMSLQYERGSGIMDSIPSWKRLSLQKSFDHHQPD